MGVLNHGTYPSVATATRAACEFGVDANEAGHDLTKLAALMNKTDPTTVNVTLAAAALLPVGARRSDGAGRPARASRRKTPKIPFSYSSRTTTAIHTRC